MRIIKFISILLLTLILISCSTLEQTVSLDQIDIGIPVSGSMLVLDDDRIIEEPDFTARDEFTFNKIAKVSIHSVEDTISIDRELEGEIDQGDYDGIVGLKVKMREIDTSAISMISNERYYGILLALSGACFYYIGTIGDYDNTDSSTDSMNDALTAKSFGAVVFGAGSLFFLGSFIHEKIATVKYSMDISGYKVKY